jgi:hypothetical protein
MAKIDAKEVGLTTLLGTGVVVLTPMIGGVLGGLGLELLNFEILPGILSVGTTIAAGVSAFVVDLAITKWLK